MTEENGLMDQLINEAFSQDDEVDDRLEEVTELPDDQETMKKVGIIKEMMDEAEDLPIEADSIWYLVSARWINSWIRWAKNSGEEPMAPIDNADIIDEDNVHLAEHLIAIKGHIRRERDYFVLPENAWNLLVSWYGIEGMPLKRRAYEYARGETTVEIHLAHVDFSFSPSSIRDSIQLSHSNTVSEMKDAIKCFLEHKYKDVSLPPTLFYSFALDQEKGSVRYLLDEDSDEKTMDEVGLLSPDAYVWVDEKPDPTAKGLNSSVAFDESKLGPGAGLVGLRNLGNTCFMNSALQCLSNCELLSRYFLSGQYRHDLNKTNRLGTGGALAEEFAGLLRSIWGSIPYSVVDPMSFKYTLGRFEGRFLGYSQQDSQEFLSALLDRIHEDLNRIKQKPYVEMPDRNGRPDAVVAKEAWDLHKTRNDSHVVDLFHGQLKSTVTCPTCNHISVTFDPFMFLTLPIPNKKVRQTTLTVISEDFIGRIEVAVPRSDRTIGGLKTEIFKKLGLSADNHDISVVEVYNSDIYRQFKDDEESLINIRQPGDDIFAFVIRKDTPHVWITFSVADQARRLGHPVLLPIEKPLGDDSDSNNEIIVRSLARYSQNPRIEGDKIKVHARKLEKKLDFPIYHAFFDPEFISNVASDAQVDHTEESTISIAFFHILFAHHSSRLSPSFGYEKPAKEEVSLYECLDLFVQEEKLGSTESWYCSKCKEHQEGAGKKLDLWKLPDVLVVHLKRFAYDSYFGHKISTPVSFPISDLSFKGRVVSEDENVNDHYELFAISEHYGSLGGGHYTALAKNHIDQHWYEFDDSRVTPGTEDSIQRGRQSAYLLFYQRKPATSSDANTSI